MPYSAASYVIFTISILAVAAFAVLYFAFLQYSIAARALEIQAREVAAYVARNVVELLSLANSSSSELLLKELEIPPELGGHSYTLSLTERNGALVALVEVGGVPRVAVAAPVTRLSSALSLDCGDCSAIELDDIRVVPTREVHSGHAALEDRKVVVWIQRRGGVLVLGLGIARRW